TMSPTELKEQAHAANDERATHPEQAQSTAAEVGPLMEQIGRAALDAAAVLAQATTQQKNAALVAAAKAVRASVPDLLAANMRDMEAAHARKLSNALLDRLELNEKRIEG